MFEQIFISYRRDGGDVTAKLICEALKNRGFTVFYDYDSISGGYFDERIIDSIKNCNDFVLILPENGLDRCSNEKDWVRQEIGCAMKERKNIIPVMLPDFEFPVDLPEEIKDLKRINGIHFIMAYFEAVMDAIVERLTTADPNKSSSHNELNFSDGLEYLTNEEEGGYNVRIGKCADVNIIIPSSHKGKAVVGIAKGGFEECSGIESVTLPETIKTIEKSAFSGCTHLKSVNLPEGLLSIGGWSFYNCTALTQIMLPKSLKTIGKRAFANCTGIKEYTVTDSNGEFCSEKGNLYSKDRQKLINYALSNPNKEFYVPETVKTVGDSAFSVSPYLEKIILSDQVENIEDYAFDSSHRLKEVILPKRISSWGEYLFKDCKALEGITIPQGVTEIPRGTFRNCTELKYVEWSDEITTVGQSAFNSCAKLNTKIPESVREIGPWGFWECVSFNKIFISKNLTSLGLRAFAGCKSVSGYVVDENNPCFCALDGNLFSKDKRTLINFALGNPCSDYNIPNGVVRISSSAFSEAKNLKYVQLPESVKSIEDYAFNNCSSIEKIKLPEKAMFIGEYAFGGLGGVKEISVPHGVDKISKSAFKNCFELTTVFLPETVESLEEDAFRNCAKLKTVNLPSKLRRIENGAFYSCKELTGVRLPSSLEFLGKWAFYECYSLRILHLPNSLNTIDKRALASCNGLTSIKVGIFNKHFKFINNCLYTKDMKTLISCCLGSSQNKYTVADGVTLIDECAFSRNTLLEEITIPETVNTLGDYAFNKCSSLKKIYYKGTVKMWNSINRGTFNHKDYPDLVISCKDGNLQH